MVKNKAKVMIIGVALISFLLTIGISYAIWQIALQQESTNIVNTTCFKINFKDQNEIHLQSTYPISDEEGMNLVPYTFTIENICNTNATYQINLEELMTELKKLSKEYIKVSLNNSKGKNLNTYETVEKTLSNAESSKKLTTGVLKAGDSKTFDLRLWLDENTPAMSDVMNASFESKITIIAVQKEGLPEVKIAAQEELDGITVDISAVENPKNETLTYFYQLNEEAEIESEKNTHTFTGLSDGKYKTKGRAETLDGVILEEKELDVIVAYEQVYVSVSGNDETGNGSIDNPFATLQPAYNKVKSGGEILLLSDITATSTTNMNIENKEVTLRSNGSNQYSVTKSSNLITPILYITNANNLITTNLIFDGNNIESTGSLLEGFSSAITLNNTIIQNNINKGRQYNEFNINFAIGGGILVSEGTLNIRNGSVIQNNKVTHADTAFGAGVGVLRSTVNLDGGIITNNAFASASANENRGGGLAILLGSNFQFTSGEISNNRAWHGGGVFVGVGSLIDGVGKNSTLNMSGGTIKNNAAVINGGGVDINTSDYILSGGIITNNTATYGGGVLVITDSWSSSMNMTNGTIINNTATDYGGGIAAVLNSNQQVIVYIKGGSISDNTAPTGPNTYALNGAQIIDQR